MMIDTDDHDTPNHPGSLEGISRLRIDCEEVDLAIEADPSLRGTIHLAVEAGARAPSLIRERGEIILHQRGRYRTGGRPATLLIPEEGCPPISGSINRGDLNVEQVNAPVALQHGAGDVRVVGGRGDLSLESGKGDLLVTNRDGAVVAKLGMGDVNITRCRDVIALANGKGDVRVDACEGSVEVKTGSGDIAVSDCSGDLTVKVGSGDVIVTRPRGALVMIANGSGDVMLRSGSVAGLKVRSGRGDIVSSTHLLFTPGQEGTRGEAAAGVGDDDEGGRASRLLRSKGIEFMAGDRGVRISRGPFHLEASDEGVRIQKGNFGFEAGDSGVRVVSGTDEEIGAFSVETGAGDIAIDVPSGIPLRVEALVNGDVRSDIPLMSVGRPGPRGATQRFIGVTDPHAAERLNLRVKSDRGDIRIRSASGIPAPPAPPAPPRPRGTPPIAMPGPEMRASPEAPTARIPSRDEQMRAVLDALARGEITVAEAERRLAEIEGR